jgi:hypothetical protein
MEATKRERIILFGVVPVVCAIVGAVGTVVAGRIMGTDQPGNAVMAIVQAANLTAAEKMKMLELANKNDQQFYDFLRTWLFMLAVPIGAIAYAVADWIRSR